MEYNAGKNRYPHIKPSKLIDYIKKNMLPHKNYLYQMTIVECYFENWMALVWTTSTQVLLM